MNYFLGIDVSSSRTHALIVDENGRCVGFGRSGGDNHQDVGDERLAEVLQLAFSDACEMSAIETSQIAGAGFDGYAVRDRIVRTAKERVQ